MRQSEAFCIQSRSLNKIRMQQSATDADVMVWPRVAHLAQSQFGHRAARSRTCCYDRRVRPTPEQLAPLSRFERASFRVADALASLRLTPLSSAWNTVVMGGLLYACGGRRFRVHGLENLARYG